MINAALFQGTMNRALTVSPVYLIDRGMYNFPACVRRIDEEVLAPVRRDKSRDPNSDQADLFAARIKDGLQPVKVYHDSVDSTDPPESLYNHPIPLTNPNATAGLGIWKRNDLFYFSTVADSAGWPKVQGFRCNNQVHHPDNFNDTYCAEWTNQLIIDDSNFVDSAHIGPGAAVVVQARSHPIYYAAINNTVYGQLGSRTPPESLSIGATHKDLEILSNTSAYILTANGLYSSAFNYSNFTWSALAGPLVSKRLPEFVETFVQFLERLLGAGYLLLPLSEFLPRSGTTSAHHRDRTQARSNRLSHAQHQRTLR